MKKYTNKLEELRSEIISRLGELIEEKGDVGANTSAKTFVVVLLDDHEELCYNLEGSRYLFELNENTLFDNKGYQYHIDELTIDQIAPLVDAIEAYVDIIDFVEYKGITYPMREVVIEGETRTISVQSLDDVLINPETALPWDDEAEKIDDMIFYYVEDEQFELPRGELAGIIEDEL